MPKTILIDGNAVGYGSHYATKLTVGDLQTQAIFGFAKTLHNLRTRNRGARIIVLWDGRAQWRFDLHPEYKSNRDNDPKKAAIKEAYVAQRPYIQRLLESLGVRQLTDMEQEADDLAGYLVQSLTGQPGYDPKANPIDLITGDEDWAQLVRPGVTWFDPRNDEKVITRANLFDMTGYPTPAAFLQGKCLTGDTSDVIPGVGGIGKGKAPLFIAEFGSVREFWRRCDAGEFVPKYVMHKNLASPAGRARFAKNLKLMNLMVPRKPNAASMRNVVGKFDLDKFGALCEELNFVSILRKLDEFVLPFEPQPMRQAA